ncbi:MAG: hypothetical protein F4W99_03135 [Chloroflexi bacterium]|nr:hypothetical protein [Chloroflexota bacterium]
MADMALRPTLSRHLFVSLLITLISIGLVLAACSDSADQEQPADSQPDATAEVQQQVEQSQQSDAQPAPQQQAAEPPDQLQASMQQQAEQPSAAQSMTVAPRQGQQGYGADGPYADSDGQSGQESSAPVPPVRQWLAEGVSLTPSVPAAFDEYGWSAVIEGDVLAVGAPYHDVLGEDTGAVFIFERIDGEWVETAYLLPPFADPLGWFGRWLAIDQGRLVIGAPYEDVLTEDGSFVEDAGVAYVYEKVGGDWIRTGTLLPAVPVTGASFGWSVAIFGDRIAVSAWEDQVEGVGAGSVTVFRQHKGLWRAEAVLTPAEPTHRQMFGRDIELFNNVLVVGAPGDDTIAEDAGAVFVWHHYNHEWNFAGRLLASDGLELDRLGSQVSLHGSWLVAGGYDHDNPLWSMGAVYVWKLDNLWNFHSKLTASDAQPGDWFGYATAIEGERMVIGAPHRAHPESQTYRSGAAYAFELRDDEWVEVGVFGPVDAVLAGERAEFGWATDVSGSTVVVGAWLADTAAGEDAGDAAVYEIPTEDASDPDPEQ